MEAAYKPTPFLKALQYSRSLRVTSDAVFHKRKRIAHAVNLRLYFLGTRRRNALVGMASVKIKPRVNSRDTPCVLEIKEVYYNVLGIGDLFREYVGLPELCQSGEKKLSSVNLIPLNEI